MKTLHLLRHAKSTRDEHGLPDRERGLNQRGRRDAPMMGDALAARLSPQLIWVSPARRAQLTLQGLCEGWPALRERGHVTDESLYTFSSRDLMFWLAQRDAALDSCFLLGHNPALTDLANELFGDLLLDNLPTAGYIQLTLAIDDWRDLSRARAAQAWHLFPKQLRTGRG